MKLLTRLLTTALILILGMSSAAADIVLQEPVAVVDLTESQMITGQQLNEKYEQYITDQSKSGRDTSSISRRDVLEIMINDILIIQGAEREGISISEDRLNTLVRQQKESIAQQVGTQLTDQQFEQILMQYYSMTIGDYRQKLKENYLVDTYVRRAKKDIIDSAKPPAEAEVTSFFKRNAAKFINPEYVRISHIYINIEDRTAGEAKALADKISRNIRYGVESYDNQVMQYSDDEGSRFSGGVIGWLAIDDDSKKEVLGQEFYDVAFSLDEGQVSRPVRSNAGYHIIKILERREPRMLGLDDPIAPGNDLTVRQYITQNIYQANQTEAYNSAVTELLKDLREEAEITILMEE